MFSYSRLFVCTALLLVLPGTAAATCMIAAVASCPPDQVAALEQELNAAAGDGSPVHLLTLGRFYRAAPEPFHDEARAFAYVDRASHAGEPWAKMVLADMLVKGEGAPSDPAEAENLLREATDAGLKGPAPLALGKLRHAFGDYGAAIAYFEKASSAGEPWANLALADMLAKGEGTPADRDRAESLLQETADAGLRGPALFALGNLYRASAAPKKAIAAFEQASSAGEPWANLALADMLANGEGVRADRERAEQLLHKALNDHHLAYAHVELIALAARNYVDPDAVRRTLDLLKVAHGADPELAKNAFDWLDPNQKVAVIQGILRIEETYSGRLDGLLTRATLKAIGAFCWREGIDCRKEAMPSTLLDELLVHLAAEDVPA